MINIITNISGDCYNLFTKTYAKCNFGDTIRIESGKYYTSKTIEWCDKRVHVECLGMELYPLKPLVDEPLLIFGASLGKYMSEINWHGGRFISPGGIVIQNLNYCKNLYFESISGPLTIRTDVSAAYLNISANAITSSKGCIILDQVGGKGWSNMVTFSIPSMNCSNYPVVIQKNKDAGYRPDGWLIDRSAIEANDKLVLFDVGNMELTLRDCWIEWLDSAGFDVGSVGSDHRIRIVRTPGRNYNNRIVSACSLKNIPVQL